MCPGAGPAARTMAEASRATVAGSVSRTSGSRLPCSATRAPTAARARADVDGPVESHAVRAARRDLVEPRAAALREHDARDLASRARRQRREHVAHRREREAPVRVGGQEAAPGVEDHHRVGAALDLRVEIGGDRAGVDGDDLRQEIRPRVRHLAHGREVRAAAAFDHVAGERERAAREADQRHAPAQFALDERHRVEHVRELRHVRHGERADRGLVAHLAREARALRLPRTTGRVPSRRESSGCPRTGWPRRAGSAQAAAASPRPRAPDWSRAP